MIAKYSLIKLYWYCNFLTSLPFSATIILCANICWGEFLNKLNTNNSSLLHISCDWVLEIEKLNKDLWAKISAHSYVTNKYCGRIHFIRYIPFWLQHKIALISQYNLWGCFFISFLRNYIWTLHSHRSFWHCRRLGCQSIVTNTQTKSQMCTICTFWIL